MPSKTQNRGGPANFPTNGDVPKKRPPGEFTGGLGVSRQGNLLTVRKLEGHPGLARGVAVMAY